MTEPKLQPLEYIDGYLRIEDHALIGDGATAALVARDGTVDWLCVPRFDSPPLFCSLLDTARGRCFRLSPTRLLASRQYYEPDTGVVHTEMQTASGLLRVTDALTFRSGADLTEDARAARQQLLRRVTVLDGVVPITVSVAPPESARAEPVSGGFSIHCPDIACRDLHLSASFPLQGLQTEYTLRTGETAFLQLRWGSGSGRHHPVEPEEVLENTIAAWHRWIKRFQYDGPQAWLVRRSAITLKLLDHFESGAIVAAPTSSLPEAIGGVRNWDYRFAWIRDAAFSVYALRRIGYSHEAGGFLSWVLDAVERNGGRPSVLYTLDGDIPGPEVLDPNLEGYRGSRPVRWGNGAAHQTQHDVYGEILDCAYQWASHHDGLDAPLWERLRALVEAAKANWRTPDHGIWEVRTAGRPFTYSTALCHVALDRSIRLAQQYHLPGDITGWRAAAEEVLATLLEEAWSPELQSLTEHLGGGGLDASMLALPLRRVLCADDPRMVATTEAITRKLGVGKGLLFRYIPEDSPDGLPGHEGAFLLCSFWLVDNFAGQGRMQEAMDLYDSLCARAGDLGLLPEQIDPTTGAFLGNYPQAFSHIGVIASGYNLGRLLRKRS